MLFGLTPLGVAHTAISLVAGAMALVRHRAITPRQQAGRVYIATTALTALTALGIFQHGGFGAPHALAILTLLALAWGLVAPFTSLFGRWSPLAEALGYSTTILFQLIPGVTETLTRLPPQGPWLPNAEAPEFKPIYGALLLLFVAGLALQWRWLRRQPAMAAAGATGAR